MTAALLAAASGLPAASAAPAIPVLGPVTAVSASRSASMLVRLGQPVTLTQEYRAQHLSASSDFVVSGTSGPVAVVLVGEQRFGSMEPPLLAAISLPASIGGGVGMHAQGFDPVTGAEIAVSGRVPTGLYRMYVVTEAPATVRFRLPGVDGRGVSSLVARTPVRTAIRTASGSDLAYQSPTFTESLSFDVRRRSVALAFHWISGDAIFARDTVICVSRTTLPSGQVPPGCPGSSAGNHRRGDFPQAPATHLEHQAWYSAGQGPYAVAASTQVAGLVRRIGAVLAWVELDPA